MDTYNSELMTVSPQYNTYTCKKLHVNVFDGFIRNARTDRYNIMCYVYAHEKNNPSEHDDGNSCGGYPLPSNSTT